MTFSHISADNDANGSWYQSLVAKHLEKKTGLSSYIKETHGIDVVNGKYSWEVKGMKNLFRKPSKAGGVQVNHWKIDQITCPSDITHVAFVLYEEYIYYQPLIYVVAIGDIKKRFDRKPDTKWIYFPIHWVFNHLIFKLSRIPGRIGLERKRIINKLASEIHEELMSPGANYDDLRNWADEIIKLTAVKVG